jgi:hypothetical protein
MTEFVEYRITNIGGWMPRRQSRTPLQIKFRVVPLVRMPKSQLFIFLKRACESGVVPPEIEIQTLDWQHKRGGVWRPGTVLSGDDAAELRNCYEMLTGAVGKRDVRVEKPR